MTYFNSTTIRSYLGVTDTTESSYIDLVLELIEEKLVSNGVYINTDNTSSTTNVYLDRDVEYETIYTPFFYEIDTISIKTEEDNSIVKVLDISDYRTLTHMLSPNPLFGVMLSNSSLCYPHYLSITGKRGWGSTLPNSINIAVIELCSKLLANYKNNKSSINNNGGVVSSKKIGDVSINYDNSIINSIYMSAESIIDSDAEFNSIINKFKIPKL